MPTAYQTFDLSKWVSPSVPPSNPSLLDVAGGIQAPNLDRPYTVPYIPGSVSPITSEVTIEYYFQKYQPYIIGGLVLVGVMLLGGRRRR